MEEQIIAMIKEIGFPSVICLILLYDKIRTNGSLKEVVRNNNEILKDLKEHIYKNGK